jgi:MFS transporter, DHA1 family, tetracycline resistance protein
MTSVQSAKLPRRLHPFILAVAFISTYYVALLGPVLPAVAEPLGGDAFTIGLLFASYSFAQFLTAPGLGALGDRYGRRAVLLISFGGVITGFLVFTIGVVTGAPLWVLFVGWMIAGASDCWIATAFSYVADTTEPAERTRFFAFLIAGIGSAFVIGPATSAVFSATSPTAPLYVLLGLLAVAAVWGYFSMPESLPPSHRARSIQLGRLNPGSQIRDILRFPQLRLLLLSYFLYWPSVIVLSSNLPTLLTDRIDSGPELISTVLIIFGVLVVAVQLGVIPLLLRRFQEIHLAIFGALLSAAAYVLFALFSGAGTVSLIFVGIILYGLGQPLVQTCLTGAMSKSMTADIQGRVQGSVAAAMALAQVVGPFAAGWLYQAVTPSAP